MVSGAVVRVYWKEDSEVWIQMAAELGHKPDSAMDGWSGLQIAMA